MTTALASASRVLHQQLGAIAMDARQFHHPHAVTSFDDVMDLCVEDDVMKPSGVSPRDAGVSPPSVTTTGVDGDDQHSFGSCSAMDAQRFHHAHAVTSFDDVMDLGVDDDVMKPSGVSRRDAGVSPPPVTTTTPIVLTPVDGDDQHGLSSYRLDHDDSAGSSVGSAVQPTAFDHDVAAATDLCLSDALRLASLPAQRTDASSPLESPRSAARQGNGGCGPRISPGQCKVCGDEATGMYFGALVCVPCKTFFLRYAGDGFSFVCKANKDCDISVSTRTQCKYCRYQKCLKAGMYRRVRPAQVQLSAGQQLCVVCNDVANGIHFGAITCEGCKKFFRRGLTEHATYVCKSGQNCVINPRTRNSCRYCRFQTCLRVGMSREAIQMGRPSKICGSDCASSGMTSPHQQPHQHHQGVVSPSPTAAAGSGGFLGGVTLPHAAGSATAGWRPGDDRLHHNWTVDYVTWQALRRPSDTWSAQYSDSGTGGLLTDDAGSLEPSPKRRHSDSYASSSSPYQFSPPPSGSGSSVDLPLAGARSGSSDNSQRSRQSSMSSQDAAAAYHGRGLWGTSPTTTASLAGPPTTTSYGVLRMSGGEMVQRGSSTMSQQDAYMHWNMPLSSATTTATSVKLEQTHSAGGDVGAFQAREMNDVIENIIRQQNHPITAPDLATEFGGLHSVMSTRDAALPLHQHQQQQDELGSITTGTVKLFVGQALSATGSGGGGGGSTPGLVPSFSPVALDIRPVLDGSSVDVDASDWINHLPDDLTDDKLTTTTNAVTSCLADEGPDAEIEARVQAAMSYWLRPELPDENVMLADRHWDVLNRVVPAYNRFVQFGTNVNRKLKIKFDEWSKEHPDGNQEERSAWIQSEVIPIYTMSSITYFRSLPGFNDLSAADQGTLIRLGQSQSRILVAALHWYDPEENNFRHFLSWRIMPFGQTDHFRQRLIEYSKRVSMLELDPIEAALLNVLVVIASDYPGLEGTASIEDYRRQILCTFRAYTTAKFGTPNTRLERLFQYIPDVRRLGLWHYKMTTDPSLGVAQQRQS